MEYCTCDNNSVDKLQGLMARASISKKEKKKNSTEHDIKKLRKLLPKYGTRWSYLHENYFPHITARKLRSIAEDTLPDLVEKNRARNKLLDQKEEKHVSEDEKDIVDKLRILLPIYGSKWKYLADHFFTNKTADELYNIARRHIDDLHLYKLENKKSFTPLPIQREDTYDSGDESENTMADFLKTFDFSDDDDGENLHGLMAKASKKEKNSKPKRKYVRSGKFVKKFKHREIYVPVSIYHKHGLMLGQKNGYVRHVIDDYDSSDMTPEEIRAYEERIADRDLSLWRTQ